MKMYSSFTPLYIPKCRCPLSYLTISLWWQDLGTVTWNNYPTGRQRGFLALISGLAPTRLHCTALFCTALHCTALYCTALHCIVMPWNAVTVLSVLYITKQKMHWIALNHICLYCTAENGTIFNKKITAFWQSLDIGESKLFCSNFPLN